jgi:hypothetical protein
MELTVPATFDGFSSILAQSLEAGQDGKLQIPIYFNIMYSKRKYRRPFLAYKKYFPKTLENRIRSVQNH